MAREDRERSWMADKRATIQAARHLLDAVEAEDALIGSNNRNRSRSSWYWQ